MKMWFQYFKNPHFKAMIKSFLIGISLPNVVCSKYVTTFHLLYKDSNVVPQSRFICKIRWKKLEPGFWTFTRNMLVSLLPCIQGAGHTMFMLWLQFPTCVFFRLLYQYLSIEDTGHTMNTGNLPNAFLYSFMNTRNLPNTIFYMYINTGNLPRALIYIYLNTWISQ